MLKKILVGLLAMVMIATTLMSGALAAEQTTLQMDDRGSEVKALQKNLKRLGYKPGSADGVFGEQTQTAVIAFQQDHGLYPDGVAGPKTLAKITKELANEATSTSKKEENTTPSTTTKPSLFGGKYVCLEPGSTRSEVRILQKSLIKLGYSVKNNGRYDDATEKAVTAFQKANGLYVDGIAGPDTEKMLEKALSSILEAEALEKKKPTRTLSQGSKGKQVTALQERLADLGYWKDGNPTAKYDDATVHAVELFQVRHNLKKDGIAGPDTLDLLFSNDAKKSK